MSLRSQSINIKPKAVEKIDLEKVMENEHQDSNSASDAAWRA
jgi:hypothetical protein